MWFSWVLRKLCNQLFQVTSAINMHFYLSYLLSQFFNLCTYSILNVSYLSFCRPPTHLCIELCKHNQKWKTGEELIKIVHFFFFIRHVRIWFESSLAIVMPSFCWAQHRWASMKTVVERKPKKWFLVLKLLLRQASICKENPQKGKYLSWFQVKFFIHPH